MPKLKTIPILTLAILASLIARLFIAYNWQGLSFDEIISVLVARQPLSHMWTYLRWEMHPPLHFIYLHFWIQAFGSSEFIVRLSSIILSILSIPATYFLYKEIFHSKLAGYYSSFISSFIFITFFYSIVARMYILLYLTSVLSFYFFIKIINGNQKNPSLTWILYTLTTILALYSHLTTICIPLIQLIYLLYLKHKQTIKPQLVFQFIKANIIVAVLYLPWFISFVTIRLATLGSNAWYTFTSAKDFFVLSIPTALSVGTPNSQILPLLVSLFILIIILINLFTLKLDSNNSWVIKLQVHPATILGLLIIYIPMVILFVLDLNSLRFYNLSVIGLILLIIQALININQKIWHRLFIGILVAIMLYPIASIANIPDIVWPKIAQFIETREQPGDTIIAAYSANMLALQYYYKGNLNINTFADPVIQAESQDNLELVMRTNSIIYVNQDNIADFDKLVENNERIFFLFSKALLGQSYEYFTNWFIDHNWQRIDHLGDSNFNAPEIWLLTKPE